MTILSMTDEQIVLRMHETATTKSERCDDEPVLMFSVVKYLNDAKES